MKINHFVLCKRTSSYRNRKTHHQSAMVQTVKHKNKRRIDVHDNLWVGTDLGAEYTTYAFDVALLCGVHQRGDAAAVAVASSLFRRRAAAVGTPVPSVSCPRRDCQSAVHHQAKRRPILTPGVTWRSCAASTDLASRPALWKLIG